MRRRAGLFLLCGLVLPLVIVANASAQSSTVIVTPNPAPPGSVVTVTGSGYSQLGPVDLRFDFRDADFARPGVSVDSAGRFSTSFPLPASLTPGLHLLIATQVTAQGRHRGFGPGRGKLRVLPAAGSAGVPAGRSPGDGPPLALMIGALALLLAGTATLTVRTLRTSNRPAGDGADLAR